MEEPKPSEGESPDDLRDKAAHARQLAFASYDEALSARLRALADELDAQADALERRKGGGGL